MMLITMFIKAFTSVILVVLNLYWQYDDLYWLCWCKDTFIMNKLVILGSHSPRLAFEVYCREMLQMLCYPVLFCPLWPCCAPPGPTFVSIIRVWWCQPPPPQHPGHCQLSQLIIAARFIPTPAHLVQASWWCSDNWLSRKLSFIQFISSFLLLASTFNFQPFL